MSDTARDPETLSEAEVARCMDYFRRCGQALREDIRLNNGRMPAVQHCPHPQNEIEEIALKLWMETVADGLEVPVTRAGFEKTYDA